jgi:phosphoribosylglycinamide formyltransferase-1
VDEGIDTGPIIAQETVDIPDGITEAELLVRIHAVEHRLYPAVLRDLIAQGERSGRTQNGPAVSSRETTVRQTGLTRSAETRGGA